MSNPVSNAEVEDVLSSIRRLVSEDRRPLQTPKPDAPVTQSSDRLVLTPALRVAEPPRDPAPEARSVPERAVPPLLLDDAVPEDTASEHVEDRAATPLDLTTDIRAEKPAARPEWQEDEAEVEAAAAADAAAYLADPVDEVEAAQDTSTSALGAKIAALETAIGRIPERWEPDVAGTDDYSGTEPPAMAWEDDEEPEITEAPMAYVAEEDLAEEDVEDTASEEIAAPREEPSTPRPQPGSEEAAFGRVVGAAPRRQPDDEDGFAYGGEDQLIDEEALRDLVAEIVRAELQGALGERITRNVRKLVRREIHRALTAQELE